MSLFVSTANGQGINCCPTSQNTELHPRCAPIDITGDPFFSRFRRNCMNFVRSMLAVGPAEECTFGFAEQVINILKPYDPCYLNLVNKTYNSITFVALLRRPLSTSWVSYLTLRVRWSKRRPYDLMYIWSGFLAFSSRNSWISWLTGSTAQTCMVRLMKNRVQLDSSKTGCWRLLPAICYH